jgi:ABC-2 type transport system ATP-binding protein
VSLQALSALTAGQGVRWTKENEMTAKVWIPREMNVSDVLSRVVGAMEISDIKIFETNTDEIVREIYRTGGSEKTAEAENGEALPAVAGADSRD